MRVVVSDLGCLGDALGRQRLCVALDSSVTAYSVRSRIICGESTSARMPCCSQTLTVSRRASQPLVPLDLVHGEVDTRCRRELGQVLVATSRRVKPRTTSNRPVVRVDGARHAASWSCT